KQHEMQDFFIKEITKYYKNPTLDVGVPDNVTDGVTIPTDEQKKNPVKDKGKKVGNKWRRNQHNILWKPEKGTFTANSNIYTRYNGPWTGWEIAGMLYAGQSVNYDEVYDFDGYIWIAWTVDSGARVYMPIGESAGNGSRAGDAWGTFS
ncbi:SH3 domain-containing protein, partial [Staphylococcus pseudoxylosus]